MKSNLRAIIVDDDLLSRNLLSSLVDFPALGFDLVGEAADGQEALELCRRLAPDLLFLDVSMPRMGGIALMQALEELPATPHIVVVSSYSNYEFVRETFRLGAVDYLLKDDLDAARFAQLLRELRERLTPADPVPAQQPQDLDFAQDQPLSLFLCGIPFFTLLDDAGEEDSGLLQRSIQSFILQLLDPATTQYLRWLRPGALSVLTTRATDGELERRIRQCMSTYLDKQAEVVRIETTPAGYEAACEAADRLLFGDPSQDVYENTLQQIREALIRGDHTGALAALETLRGETLARSPHLCAAQPMALALIAALREAGVETPLQHLGQIEDVPAFFAWIRRLLESALAGARQQYSPHVQGALAYIQAHFRHSVTLGKVARHVNVVPSYLSTSFHHETGFTFVDYLNRHRIAEAQRLLAQPGCAVKDVYHQVGFNSYNYFFKVYRQVTGESPAGRSRGGEGN